MGLRCIIPLYFLCFIIGVDCVRCDTKKQQIPMDEERVFADDWGIKQSAQLNITNKSDRIESTGNMFPCNTSMSTRIPKSVHELTPGHIRVIGALGDSITAGNGILAEHVVGILTQYRGRAWSIGGAVSYENGVKTLPNILKHYNSHLTGYSTSDNANLDVARASSTAGFMLEQAKTLVERMRQTRNINFESDWKLITLFVGGNDLCNSCYDEEEYSAENYRENIMKALDYLHREVPRCFVNVVSPFDLTPIAQLTNSVACSIIHRTICSCALSEPFKDKVSSLAMRYSKVLEDLMSSGRYDTTSDFTVVFQPFLRDNDMPRTRSGDPDFSMYAPDCFHFSQKGHNVVARLLWNQMFQPVGQKSTLTDYHSKMYCPKKGELLKTRKSMEHTEQVYLTASFQTPGRQIVIWPNIFVVIGTLVSLALVGVFLVRAVRSWIRPHILAIKEEKAPLIASAV